MTVDFGNVIAGFTFAITVPAYYLLRLSHADAPEATTRVLRAMVASLAAWMALTTLLDLLAGHVLKAVFHASCSVLLLHLLWVTRPPKKKRRPSRVAGVVRDLGHRLTVTPEPSGVPS